ncbi:MAG: hypothetical protein UMS36scaffold28_59 [Phage 59_13]|nr:MAG: hypothetical protein UMS36scaffold28_59 [Phage 59_13]
METLKPIVCRMPGCYIAVGVTEKYCPACAWQKRKDIEAEKTAAGYWLFPLILLLLMVAPVHAAAPVDMLAYADAAIMNAAEHDHRAVTLTFGDADQESIDAVADELRSRGYQLDEETSVLNPSVIRVRYLVSPAVAKAVTR